MRRKTSHGSYTSADDADIAAGGVGLLPDRGLPTPPGSRGGVSVMTSASDIEFFEDMISEPVLVLGMDISHLSRNAQFLCCATGVFCFSLLYGYLQELLSVQLCSRQLGLFLAMIQFVGYTLLSFLLNTFVYGSKTDKHNPRRLTPKSSNVTNLAGSSSKDLKTVPFKVYLGLSLVRALDLGMTNLAMQYINYPAKTLMKSSRVIFTMIFGVFILKKSYQFMDYFVVMCMFLGLVLFMHADSTSSAVFQPLGVIMLTVSMTCDGAISNISEQIMNQFGVGQDEFIFRMYSIALVAISAAAIAKGDFRDGVVWMVQPGTYAEQQSNVPLEERNWSPMGKFGCMVLFSSMGFFGSSCSAAITKNFGALTMSITSTVRKATTLFLSFMLFDNQCTFEHIAGIVIFMGALTVKSLRRKNKKRRSNSRQHGRQLRRLRSSDLELGDRPSSVPITVSASFDNATVNTTDHTTRSRESSSFGGGRKNAAQPPSGSLRYGVV